MTIREDIEKAPVSELQKRLYGDGKRYEHMGICSGNPRKPIGTPGCICLRALRTGAEDLIYYIPRETD